MWYVYILECGDGTLYTGATTDLKRRVEEHKRGEGAKYTKIRGVNKLIYSETSKSHGDALRREIQIKKWNRSMKLDLVRTWNPERTK